MLVNRFPWADPSTARLLAFETQNLERLVPIPIMFQNIVSLHDESSRISLFSNHV